MGFFSDLFGGKRDFTGQSLVQEDYDRRDFTNGVFVRAEVTQCELKHARLSGADFTGARISQCDFSGADLRGVNFTDAEVVQTEFAGADFTGAITARTKFTQCDHVPGFAFYFYRDIDDDEVKWPLVVGKLASLSAIADGAVKERRDDGSAWFSGTYANRPFRIVTSLTWGRPKLEMKTSRPAAGTFTVRFDPDVKPLPPPSDDPVWESTSTKRAKHRYHLTPALYLERSSEQDLAKEAALMQGSVPHVLAALLPAVNGERLDMSGTELALAFRDDLLHPEFVGRCQRALEESAKLLGELGG